MTIVNLNKESSSGLTLNDVEIGGWFIDREGDVAIKITETGYVYLMDTGGPDLYKANYVPDDSPDIDITDIIETVSINYTRKGESNE